MFSLIEADQSSFWEKTMDKLVLKKKTHHLFRNILGLGLMKKATPKILRRLFANFTDILSAENCVNMSSLIPMSLLEAWWSPGTGRHLVQWGQENHSQLRRAKHWAVYWKSVESHRHTHCRAESTGRDDQLSARGCNQRL